MHLRTCLSSLPSKHHLLKAAQRKISARCFSRLKSPDSYFGDGSSFTRIRSPIGFPDDDDFSKPLTGADEYSSTLSHHGSQRVDKQTQMEMAVNHIKQLTVRRDMNAAEFELKRLLNEKNKPSVELVNTVISGWCSCLCFERAEDLIYSMKQVGMNPNEESFNPLIKALLKEERSKQMVDILKKMISFYRRKPSLEFTKKLFTLISSSQTQRKITLPDCLQTYMLYAPEVLYTDEVFLMLLDTYKLETSLILPAVDDLVTHHHKVITVPIYDAIVLCFANNSLQKAVQFIRFMQKQHKMHPSPKNYRELSNITYSNQSDHKYLLNLEQEMREQKIIPFPPLYNSILRNFINDSNEALKYFAYAEEQKAYDSTTFAHLVATLVSTGQIDKAEHVVNIMEDRYGIKPPFYAYALLAKGYKAIGRHNELPTLMEHMHKNGYSPDAVEVVRRSVQMDRSIVMSQYKPRVSG